MSYSIQNLDSYLVKKFLESSSPEPSVIDVGVGAGKTVNILGAFCNVLDGIEAREPVIKEFKLEERYDHIFQIDARDFKHRDKYDTIIMGDMIEHLSVKEAQALVERMKKWVVNTIFIQVPYKYPQEALHDNPFELHVQWDLTHENFMERYPWFKLVVKDEQVGLYMFKK